jgi:hypothetical protein
MSFSRHICEGCQPRPRMPSPKDAKRAGTLRDQTEFTVRFRALPDSVPVAVRLKRLLKACLRAYRFRAVTVEEVKDSIQKARGPIND